MAVSEDSTTTSDLAPGTPRRRAVMAAVLGGGLLGACSSEPVAGGALGDTDPAAASVTGSVGGESSVGLETPTASPSTSTPTTMDAGTPTAGTTKATSRTGTTATRATSKSGATTTSSTSKTTSTTSTTSTSTTTKAPEPVDATLAEIPVGGAVIKTIKGRPVALTQPSSGTVRAYDARCTHQGCPVKAAGGRFECPCHGSAFAIVGGAVLNGPATTALSSLPVRVHDGGVSIG